MWNRFGRGSKVSRGCQPSWLARCIFKLRCNVWCLFAGSALVLFVYALFCPNLLIMLVLFAIVLGLFLLPRV